MYLQVVGRGFPITAELRARAERKLAKLERRVGDRASAEMTLSSAKNPSIADGCIAEVAAQLGAETFHVRESASTMEAAIDQAADRIVQTVSRHNEQRRRHRPHHFEDDKTATNGASADAEEETDDDAVDDAPLSAD